jgi:hypothetical protein
MAATWQSVASDATTREHPETVGYNQIKRHKTQKKEAQLLKQLSKVRGFFPETSDPREPQARTGSTIENRVAAVIARDGREGQVRHKPRYGTRKTQKKKRAIITKAIKGARTGGRGRDNTV